jgi:hypothetical protein
MVEPHVNAGASRRAAQAADLWLRAPRPIYICDVVRQLDFAGAASQDTAHRLG